MQDHSSTIADLKQVIQVFVDERDWQVFHNPKNLAMSLAIETGELMEHFQWLTLEESAALASDSDKKHAAAEELADCFAYVLAIANAMDIDLSAAFADKMVKNREKYPSNAEIGKSGE